MGAKCRRSRSSQPYFTRAGGQDDGSLDKLPQIIIMIIIIMCVDIGIVIIGINVSLAESTNMNSLAY